jgi:hypothetical protein
MSNNKVIGILFLTGAILLFIPYTALAIIFDYPDILRQDAGYVLTKFHEGGSLLIFTWFAFAITGVSLIPAYILLGQKLENQNRLVTMATTIGVIGLIVQMVGLLRWTFVIPIIADSFVNADDEPTKAAAVMSFKMIHQFGGVLLGEHLGQLFTITWTLLISISFSKLKLVSNWIIWIGYITSIIYFLAQAELFATVIPGFPVWDMAGFVGSTLWLIWIIVVGVTFVPVQPKHQLSSSSKDTSVLS